jgi:hypothetical protein
MQIFAEFFFAVSFVKTVQNIQDVSPNYSHFTVASLPCLALPSQLQACHYACILEGANVLDT